MTWYAICRTRFRELYTLELKWYYIRIRYQIYRESLKDVQEEWKIINIWMKDWHGMMISSPRSIAVNWSRSSIKWITPKHLISFAFMVSILYTAKLDPPYVEQPQDKKATATSFHIDLCDSKRDWAVKISGTTKDYRAATQENQKQYLIFEISNSWGNTFGGSRHTLLQTAVKEETNIP